MQIRDKAQIKFAVEKTGLGDCQNTCATYSTSIVQISLNLRSLFDVCVTVAATETIHPLK